MSNASSNFHGLHGYFFEDLKVGMQETFSRTVTDTDMRNFTGVSGDTNPMHLNEEFAKATPFHGTIVFGMLTASLISAVIGTKLPGPGCIYMSQTLKFLAPVRVGRHRLCRGNAEGAVPRQKTRPVRHQMLCERYHRH